MVKLFNNCVLRFIRVPRIRLELTNAIFAALTNLYFTGSEQGRHSRNTRDHIIPCFIYRKPTVTVNRFNEAAGGRVNHNALYVALTSQLFHLRIMFFIGALLLGFTAVVVILGNSGCNAVTQAPQARGERICIP